MSDQQRAQSPNNEVAGNTEKSGASEDGKEILEHTLASFQSTLDDEERIRLQRMKGSPCDAASIIQFTHELDSLDANRRGKSMATTLHSLLQSVEQFYQVADTYVSSHPEIAALVWGSVKLAFMILGNFTSYFQKFSELLRGFDQLVPRFAEYQRLFPDSSRLRRATYEFQTAIIRCCSQMVLATRRPWQRQMIVALSHSFQTEMRPLVDDIRTKARCVKEEVDLAKAQADHREQVLQSQERSRAGESRREVIRWFAKSDKELQRLRREELARAREHKWATLLDRLSCYDHAAAFKSARRKRHNGTAEWAFRATEYIAWCNHGASAILHLVGKIGSGKTILAANIVDNLIRFRKQDSQAIAFFFVRFDDPPSQQSERILRSIIRQLFDHVSGDSGLLQFLERSSDHFFDNDSLMALLKERVRSFKDFLLVLDGFDECSLTDRKVILRSLSTLSEACRQTTRVKILLSSRSSVREEIDQMEITMNRITLNTPNISGDLTKYAEEILNEKISNKELVLQDELLFKDILHTVSVGGEGMFLWAYLTIEDICSQTSDSEIQESLKSIPRKLSETFDRALQRITNNGKATIAQNIFNWTATVRLPLTLGQLRESLAVNVGQSHSEPERYPNNISRLTAWCENLVYVEETDETVRFSHHSIREYLLNESKTFHIPKKPWDHHIGEICLTYLDFTDFNKALVTKSEPKLMNVANYPAGIATETVRKMISGKKKEKVTNSVQRWFQNPHTHMIPYEPRKNVRSKFGSVNTFDYPFFEYASDQWVFHTTRLRPGNTKMWNSWRRMIQTELTAWIDLRWEPKGSAHSSEFRLPSVDQSCPEFVRDHLAAWHKAVLLAAFTEHDPLMDQIFSIFLRYRVHLSPRLLRALMSAGHISIGLYSPLQLTLNNSDIHTIVVYIFTRYIAVGGWLEFDRSAEGERCDLAPTEKHLLGISQDVCTLLCEGRLVPGQDQRTWRLLAQASVSELDDDVCKAIASAFTGSNTHTEDIQVARTIQGKTIVNLIYERSEGFWLTVANHTPHESVLLPSYINMMRQSLKLALISHNWELAGLLLQDKNVDWTKGTSVDHGIVQCVLNCTKMSSRLRKRVIDSVILQKTKNVRAEAAFQSHISHDLAESPSDTSAAHLSLARETSPSETCHDAACNLKPVAQNDLILQAVERSSWEIAVALFMSGARLEESEFCQVTTEAFNKVFDCICQKRVLDNACYLSEEHGGGVTRIILCEEHNKRPPALESRLMTYL